MSFKIMSTRHTLHGFGFAHANVCGPFAIFRTHDTDDDTNQAIHNQQQNKQKINK